MRRRYVAILAVGLVLGACGGSGAKKSEPEPPKPPHVHVDDPHPTDEWRWVTVDGYKCLVYEPPYAARVSSMQCDLPTQSRVAGG